MDVENALYFALGFFIAITSVLIVFYAVMNNRSDDDDGR